MFKEVLNILVFEALSKEFLQLINKQEHFLISRKMLGQQCPDRRGVRRQARGQVIGAGGYRRQGSWLANAQESGWLEVQVWAKENTRSHDVFIVPPNRSGFRVESERTIYGDWKDGTQMFFNPDFGFEWFRRMKALGYKKELEIRGFKNVKELETGF